PAPANPAPPLREPPSRELLPATPRLDGSWQRAVRRGGARDLLPARPALRLARALLGLRRSVAEPVEELDLLVRVATHVVALGEVGHELAEPCPQLVGEVRCGGADERVDVVAGGLARHPGKPNRLAGRRGERPRAGRRARRVTMPSCPT